MRTTIFLALIATTSVAAADDHPLSVEKATQGLPGKASDKLMAAIEISNGADVKGTINCELFAKEAPLAVGNFVGLARGVGEWQDATGKWVKKPFFEGLIFHRVIPEFMIQGGDPQGTGMGGPGYKFKNETSPKLKFDGPGKLAMANAGPDTNGSQFFITEKDTASLDGGYTLFGQCDNVDLVKQIARVPTTNDRPHTPVKIVKVTISRGGGAPAKPGKPAKPAKGKKKKG
jgi:cyclophilin family peptidyl-prolyl cis-trans isomerase